MHTDKWTPEQLARINSELENASPREVLSWGFEHFAPGIVQATSFGPSGVVLLHLVARLRPETPVFYVDTDLLFPETYQLRDELAERFGIRFERVSSEESLREQADQHGSALWARNPDACCAIRKVEPLRRYLSDKQAWITGVRRDHSKSRSSTPVVQWDFANNLVKLNPLATWTSEDVWSYIHLHELPYNRLHDDGYPSIGCMPCTRRVKPGDDPRAGRWSGHTKTECGIHVQFQAA